ncbi:PTS lactose/cellobiose transporter subunit IIA [Marinilactibacillus sp. GCM10026970]|uniref:PTS lactose/cellobiose transporter subunit IIA n=1 Tax=Marinilactibacillus sp. GCM10026970 TaxID=3252642 RepID=UPI00362212F8
MNNEQEIMQIIVHGGNARSKALMAVRSSREQNFELADTQLAEAKEAMGIAHKVQTKLIQAETRGEKIEINLLMVHAQDHLMNAMTVVELAVEMIADKKERVGK